MEYKKISTFILLLAIMSPAPYVFAESYATPEDRRAAIEDRRDERRASSTEQREGRTEDREERRASSTERRIEIQQNLAKRKAEMTEKRLTATVLRLDRILTRVESRIDKVESAGGTTTEATRFIAEARDYLSQASTSIATFKDLTFTDDKAKENFEKVRTLASEIKGYIREAHKSLMSAIRSLKGSSKSDN